MLSNDLVYVVTSLNALFLKRAQHMQTLINGGHFNKVPMAQDQIYIYGRYDVCIPAPNFNNYLIEAGLN